MGRWLIAGRQRNQEFSVFSTAQQQVSRNCLCWESSLRLYQYELDKQIIFSVSTLFAVLKKISAINDMFQFHPWCNILYHKLNKKNSEYNRFLGTKALETKKERCKSLTSGFRHTSLKCQSEYTQPSHRALRVCRIDSLDPLFSMAWYKIERLVCIPRNDKWDILWYTTRKRCITSMYFLRVNSLPYFTIHHWWPEQRQLPYRARIKTEP